MGKRKTFICEWCDRKFPWEERKSQVLGTRKYRCDECTGEDEE